MSRRVLGSKHASQFSINQSIIAEFRRALCFQATKRLICKKVCFKLSTKFQVKKRFDRPRRLLPGLVGSSFNVHNYILICNEEFNVPDVLIVFLWRLNSQRYRFKKQPINYRWAISRNYTWQLYEHIHVVHRKFARLACCCCLSPKFWIGLDYDNTVVNCLFSRDDFDHSVIHTWGNDKSKAVIGGVTVPQRWREHLPENGS